MRRLAIIVAGALVALSTPAAARGDAVIDWSLHAQSTILGTAPPAHASTLPFAMVHGAMYDAVNAIDRGHRRYLDVPPADRRASQDAAAATAAFQVLTTLYPTQLDALQLAYDTSLMAIPDGPRKDRGIAAGAAAAAAMLAARDDDGRLPVGTPYPFPQGTSPGAWRVSPPLTAVEGAWWVGDVKPFLIPAARWFRSEGPNALTSRAYAREFAEVKALGAFDSAVRTPDQTKAAIFWQAQPHQIYGGLLRDLSARYKLSTADNARLFATVSLGMADAAIVCWNDKYARLFWRPIDAIRLAATDGNPATEADPQWRPLFDPATQTTPALATPNFPDHPSGHGCVSGSVATNLQHFFGTDRIAFDVASSRFPGESRHFDRFSDMIGEIVEARIWGGIHFRTADVQGAGVGRRVALWERLFYFRPVHRHR